MDAICHHMTPLHQNLYFRLRIKKNRGNILGERFKVSFLIYGTIQLPTCNIRYIIRINDDFLMKKLRDCFYVKKRSKQKAFKAFRSYFGQS